MTLIRLRFLIQQVKSAIATFDHLLLVDSRNREKYRNEINEAQQHLYQLNAAFKKLETDACYLERCYRLKIKPKKKCNS
jgi:hypothetical protein